MCIRDRSEPENAAMVSIFVPGELVMAAGLTPYSVEAMSCFMAGTKCEQTFLRKTEEEGFPETMCSYHRVFLGAALTGILPKPNCMIYTNLACDGNMMTFPYLKDKFECPGFYIDVPYEKNRESVLYVADQLRKLKRFLEETTDRRISEETVRSEMCIRDRLYFGIRRNCGYIFCCNHLLPMAVKTLDGEVCRF